METEAQIEAHNARSILGEIAQSIEAACDSIGHAQERIEDLGVYRPYKHDAPLMIVALEDPLTELREFLRRVR